ncbi:MAG TPA: hypothetical protein VGN07_12005 [Steroidobacteraceae bacterium]
MNLASIGMFPSRYDRWANRWMIAGLTLGLLAISGCSGLRARPANGVQLSGAWQLNESLSDDPAAMSNSRSRSSYGGGMRRMGGGMGGGMGHGGGRMAGGAGRSTSSIARERPQTLSIDQSATQLKLVADGSSTDFVYGEKVVTSFGGTVADGTSGWKDDRFVVTLKVENGPTITRNYEAVDNGHQLIVETIMSGRGPKRTFRSVYEPAKGSSPIPPAAH